MTVTYATTNIVSNGNGETGRAATDFGSFVPPQGWISTGGMTTVVYSAGGGNDLNAADGIAAQGGNAYFAGGPQSFLSTARQVVDLSAYASRIDAGRAALDLTAQMGGFSTQDDHAQVTLHFLAADGVTVLGSLTLDGSLAVDRASATQLLTEAGSAALVAGTRSVEVTLTMTRSSGTYNDGYADNIALHLSGLTKGQLLVNGTRDFTTETVARATGVSFLAGSDSTASLSSAQFGTGLISKTAVIEGSSNVDSLEISLAPNAVFSAKNFAFVDWIEGVDFLYFDDSEGKESLTGSTRSDRIVMSGGNDSVSGQSGNDWIDGGTGRDRLRGDGGSDSFVLTNKFSSRDTVVDFTQGEDHLIVQAAQFGAGLTEGGLQGVRFIANATGTFTTTDQRFAYDTATGQLWFDQDGTGTAASNQIAILIGTPALLAGDILVI